MATEWFFQVLDESMARPRRRAGGEDAFGTTGIADGHYHDVAVGFGAPDMRHPVNDPGHDHKTENHFHTVDDTKGHGHTITPKDHTHYVEEVGHRHSVGGHNHIGTLAHRTEDYRPPWRVAKLIIRVGPEEE